MQAKYRKIRLGIIAPYWLPRHGGSEQYEHQLAKELSQQNFDVFVFCGTARKEGFDNGSLEATRFTPNGNFEHASYRTISRNNNPSTLKKLLNHYSFFENAVRWAYELNLDAVIVGSPLSRTEYIQARELYLQLKAMKIKVGTVHHDLTYAVIIRYLLNAYTKSRATWNTVAKELQNELVLMFQNNDELAALLNIGSPLFFRPDFVISCSEWSNSFIDPLNTVPRFVLHPLLDEKHWTTQPADTQTLKRCNVLMINPQGRKNPAAMAALINDPKHNLTFRVLKGGWGDAFTKFKPVIEQSSTMLENRVDLIEYVKDIRLAYQSTDVMFFPSFIEGYGMAAVEPMYGGTPVISSSYPAILEAVGNGAKLLCPYRSSKKDWVNAVQEVIRDKARWSNKSAKRTEFLKKRQKQELKGLFQFLEQQCTR